MKLITNASDIQYKENSTVHPSRILMKFNFYVKLITGAQLKTRSIQPSTSITSTHPPDKEESPVCKLQFFSRTIPMINRAKSKQANASLNGRMDERHETSINSNLLWRTAEGKIAVALRPTIHAAAPYGLTQQTTEKQ